MRLIKHRLFEFGPDQPNPMDKINIQIPLGGQVVDALALPDGLYVFYLIPEPKPTIFLDEGVTMNREMQVDTFFTAISDRELNDRAKFIKMCSIDMQVEGKEATMIMALFQHMEGDSTSRR